MFTIVFLSFHSELHIKRLVFDIKKTLPIIIDYGLSLPMDKINTETMYNYFYIYAPEYYIWPLEVHYINLLLHVSPEPDNKTIEDLAKRYTKSNAALEAFSQGFRDKYQRLCVETLKKYERKPFKERIKNWCPKIMDLVIDLTPADKRWRYLKARKVAYRHAKEVRYTSNGLQVVHEFACKERNMNNLDSDEE